MIKLIGLVPLFPLIGVLINGFFGKKMSKGLCGIIASGSILASFVLSVLIFVELNGSENKSHIVNLFSWINSGSLIIPFELLVDPLSSLFLLIITGIGFLIHVYSTGYMHDDDGFTSPRCRSGSTSRIRARPSAGNRASLIFIRSRGAKVRARRLRP